MKVRIILILFFTFTVSSFVFAERIAYIADHDSLQIVDVTDPENPFRLGACDMPTWCYDVFVVDTFAYATGFTEWLQVVNVSDPTAPQIVASLSGIKGDPYAIYVSGNYAYIAAIDYWDPQENRKNRIPGMEDFSIMADVEGGIRIVDISDPLNPELVASYDTPFEARDIFVVGDIIYVAEYYSLEIYRHINTGIEESDKIHIMNHDLRISPNPFSTFTTITLSLPSTQGKEQLELKIYDVSGRQIRTFVTGDRFSDAHAVVWDGSDDDGMQLSPGVYFCRLQAGKEVLTRKIVKIGKGYGKPSAKLSNLKANESEGLYYTQRSSEDDMQTSRLPDTVEFLGSVMMPDYAWGVYVQDTVAYVADRGALVTVNVADPDSPWVMGSISSPPYATHAVGVTGQDTLACLNNGLWSTFSIIGVSDPSTPYVIGWCDIPDLQFVEPKGVQVKDTLVYLADAAEGAVIINVALPDSPFVVTTYDTPHYALDLFVQEK